MAVILPDALGVVAVDLPGGGHSWATGVRLFGPAGQLRLEWHEDQHPHSCVVGSPQVVGEQLHVDTDAHGPVVVRAIGPGDTWRVFPANSTAWEAYQRSLT